MMRRLFPLSERGRIVRQRQRRRGVRACPRVCVIRVDLFSRFMGVGLTNPSDTLSLG